jgi:hypothetical protein
MAARIEVGYWSRNWFAATIWDSTIPAMSWRMSFEDADRMLTLFHELCDIFQFYDEEDRGLEFFAPLIG